MNRRTELLRIKAVQQRIDTTASAVVLVPIRFLGKTGWLAMCSLRSRRSDKAEMVEVEPVLVHSLKVLALYDARMQLVY